MWNQRQQSRWKERIRNLNNGIPKPSSDTIRERNTIIQDGTSKAGQAKSHQVSSFPAGYPK